MWKVYKFLSITVRPLSGRITSSRCFLFMLFALRVITLCSFAKIKEWHRAAALKEAPLIFSITMNLACRTSSIAWPWRQERAKQATKIWNLRLTTCYVPDGQVHGSVGMDRRSFSRKRVFALKGTIHLPISRTRKGACWPRWKEERKEETETENRTWGVKGARFLESVISMMKSLKTLMLKKSMMYPFHWTSPTSIFWRHKFLSTVFPLLPCNVV